MESFAAGDVTGKRWRQAAIDRGSGRALFYNGLASADRRSAGDLRNAVFWYEQAALSGSFDGMLHLLRMLAGNVSRTERDVLRQADMIDIEEAYRWTLIYVAWWEPSGREDGGISAMLPDILLDRYWRGYFHIPSYERNPRRVEALERLYERATRIIGSPTQSPAAPPEIGDWRYRLDAEAMLRAEQSAREFLALHPSPPF